jgi:hypothetical protein
MDPTVIIWQFFQNEIGCFRATFELATEANPELLHEIQITALGNEPII